MLATTQKLDSYISIEKKWGIFFPWKNKKKKKICMTAMDASYWVIFFGFQWEIAKS